ncbi:MAG: hypothetical protein R3C99_14990 [Pirellulaceae bacterium]
MPVKKDDRQFSIYLPLIANEAMHDVSPNQADDLDAPAVSRSTPIR